MQQPRRRITVVIWQRRRHRRIQRTQPQIIVQHKRRMDMICTQWWVAEQKQKKQCSQSEEIHWFTPTTKKCCFWPQSTCSTHAAAQSMQSIIALLSGFCLCANKSEHFSYSHRSYAMSKPMTNANFSACSQLYFLHSWHLSPFIWIEINANVYYKTIQIENNAATICNIFLVFVILIFRLTAFLRHIESAISREPKQRP